MAKQEMMKNGINMVKLMEDNFLIAKNIIAHGGSTHKDIGKLSLKLMKSHLKSLGITLTQKEIDYLSELAVQLDRPVDVEEVVITPQSDVNDSLTVEAVRVPEEIVVEDDDDDVDAEPTTFNMLDNYANAFKKFCETGELNIEIPVDQATFSAVGDLVKAFRGIF